MEVGQEIAKNAERGAERLAAFLAWVFLSDKMQKHDTDKIPLASVGGDVVKYYLNSASAGREPPHSPDLSGTKEHE